MYSSADDGDAIMITAFYISPRTSKAIIKYWSVASVLMEKNDYGTEPDIVALDYAITQKILPKIEGHGENFEAWLKDLQNLFNSNSLTMSAAAIKNTLERGDENMQYYKFFG